MTVVRIGRQIREAVSSVVRRVIESLLRGRPVDQLEDLPRGPVLGKTGYAELSIPETPATPIVGLRIGVVGVPGPANPENDKPVIWQVNEGSWQFLAAPDWEEELPYPPGLEYGNSFWEGRQEDGYPVLSWNMGIDVETALRYYNTSDALLNTFVEGQGEIFNQGRLVAKLPENRMCIGACLKGSTLFAVGITKDQEGGGWSPSGCVLASGTVTAPFPQNLFFTTTANCADTFSIGEGVRIGTDERTIAGIPGGGQYQVNSPWSANWPAGTPIETAAGGVVESTKIYAIACTVSSEGVVTKNAGAEWEEVYFTEDTFWYQVFAAPPDGSLFAVVYDQDPTETSLYEKRRGIARFTLAEGDPPTATLELELSDVRARIEVDKTFDDGITSPCNISEKNGGPCSHTCQPNESGQIDTFLSWCQDDLSSSGSRVYGYASTVKISPATKIHLVALDFDRNNNEIKLNMRIELDNKLEGYVEQSFEDSSFISGSVQVLGDGSGSCSASSFSSAGSRIETDVVAGNNFARFDLSMDTKITLEANGVEIAVLGLIEESDTWDSFNFDAETKLNGRWTRVDTYAANGSVTAAGLECGDCSYMPLYDFSREETGVRDFAYGFNCTDPFDVTYSTFEKTAPAGLEIQRVARVLYYCDIRSNLYLFKETVGENKGIFGVNNEVLGGVSAEGPSDETSIFPYYFEPGDYQDQVGDEQHAGRLNINQEEVANEIGTEPQWGVLNYADYVRVNVTNRANNAWNPYTKFLNLFPGNQGSSFRTQGTQPNRWILTGIQFVVGGDSPDLEDIQLRNPPGDPLEIPAYGADRVAKCSAI